MKRVRKLKKIMKNDFDFEKYKPTSKFTSKNVREQTMLETYNKRLGDHSGVDHHCPVCDEAFGVQQDGFDKLNNNLESVVHEPFAGVLAEAKKRSKELGNDLKNTKPNPSFPVMYADRDGDKVISSDDEIRYLKVNDKNTLEGVSLIKGGDVTLDDLNKWPKSPKGSLDLDRPKLDEAFAAWLGTGGVKFPTNDNETFPTFSGTEVFDVVIPFTIDLQERILTIVQAAISNPEQLEAVKNLILSAFDEYHINLGETFEYD